MKRPIAFDGSIFGAGPITGVAGSFLTTLKAYARRGERDCMLLMPKNVRFKLEGELEGDGVQTIPCLPRGRWRRLVALKKACTRLDAGLLHSPVAAVPVRAPCPTVATVHDLPWLYKDLRREPGSKLGQRMACTLAVRYASAVIVPSQATRADVERYCGFNRRCGFNDSTVRVIHHGVESWTRLASEADLTGPFLVLGDDRPRKNVLRVRRAHDQAQRRVDDLPGVRFIGVSHAGGYVSDAVKFDAMRQSRALLHLSLFEGFGLPVLEAMAHGVPVVCGNRSSLPEVAGDAALMVDPEDESAMADAIARVHQDADLRRELRDRGAARVEGFTPEKTAAAWAALHEELAS